VDLDDVMMDTLGLEKFCLEEMVAKVEQENKTERCLKA
jgi:hypothetical protein